jgi:serine/threonine-protein kinase
MAMAPDGSELVYVAVTHGFRRLFRQRFDETEVREVPNTRGARFPMYSPDGDSIAFFSKGVVREVNLETGAPRDIGEAHSVSQGGCWAPDGFIYFTLTGSGGQLIEMSASDGSTRVIAEPRPDRSLPGCFAPSVLIPGESILFNRGWPKDGRNDARIVALDLASGRETEVSGVSGMDPVYLPSGHLAFVRYEQLLAVPFDPVRLGVTGGQFIVEPDVDSVNGG